MIEINNTTNQKIKAQKITTVAERFLRAYRKSGYEVSVAIVGPARMKNLNKTYRQLDKTTDVLSFPAGKIPRGAGRPVFGSGPYLGEVIINISETKKVEKYREIIGEKKEGADKKLIRPDEVFYFLLVHGLLHLLGYTDETNKKREEMIKLGKKFLANFYNKNPSNEGFL
jgi:probable rRNA maturation factor